MGEYSKWNRTNKKASALDNKYANVHAITSPLITSSNGQKMGKTASGAVWLSEKIYFCI